MSIPNTLKLLNVIGMIAMGFNSEMLNPSIFDIQLLGEVKRKKIIEDVQTAISSIAKEIIKWQQEIDLNKTETFEIENNKLFGLLQDLGRNYANIMKADFRVLSNEEAMTLFKELVKPYIKTL